MTYLIRQVFLFMMLCFAGRTMSACRTVYQDLCALSGKENNATENEYYTEDDICDCQQVTFCSIVDLSDDCNSATVIFSSNNSISSQLRCDVTALDSQANTPVYRISNKTKNEFEIRIFTEFDLGRYRIFCEAIEFSEVVVTTTGIEWNIVSINPEEVLVDSEVKLQITISGGSSASSIATWCFVKTPDNNIQILSTTWVSSNRVDCTDFSPGIPGLFMISLSSSMTPDIFDKAVSVKVTSKRPVIQEAKYSYDFEAIFISFDENIELRSTCGSVFPEGLYYFGIGFDCSTKGNILVVKMGQQFKIVNNVLISAEGKICGAGSQAADLCLSAAFVNLPVSKPKISGPNLSFRMNAACAGDTTQKYVSVNVVPSKSLNLPLQNPTSPPKNSGKGQRRNLIMWRMMRQLQNKFSSHRIVMQLNTTNIQPLFESLSSVDNDVLEVDDNLASTASVSVFLQSSPASASILAEATVTFCKDLVKPFRYKWTVNGRDAPKDGKLLILKDLPPGKYVVKCMVVDYNSTEILGEGWATTEIFTTEENVVIVPSEITVGVTDDVILRAVTWHGNSISWSCSTNVNGDCFTTDKKSVRDVINLNCPNISIPAGTLPVGMYKWTVESGKGSNTARVFIKDGNVASVGVEMSSVFIKSSEKVVLRGTVGRTRRGCRVWWSSVRKKGFDYFDLNKIGVGLNNSVREQIPGKEIPLVIPSNSENWKTAQSDSLYLFQLQVFCPYNTNNQKGSFDYIKLPLVVSSPPRLSPITVQPLSGEAMITTFSISGGDADASVDDYPLTYEWSYVNPCRVEVPIHRGAFSRSFTTFLPPGDYKLNLRVCNERQSCSTTSTPTITVIQSSEFPADNIRNARMQIQHLMTSGDILEAFGLATTVFKSLAFVAEGEVREAVYSTVEGTIKNRIEELKRRLGADPTDVDSSLEFYERAVTVAKYLRKGSDIMNRLTEFRDSFLRGASSLRRT